MQLTIPVQFQTASGTFKAELNQSLTAQMVLAKLPLESKVSLWGDEIIIETGVQASDVHATTDVNVGDVAYRYESKCVCVFFGKTPLSTSDKPVPEHPVVIIGKMACDIAELRKVRSGESIKVSAVVVAPKPIAMNDYPTSERKLSQTEIDSLVQKLLQDKKKTV
jgi:hypothetical protein